VVNDSDKYLKLGCYPESTIQYPVSSILLSSQEKIKFIHHYRFVSRFIETVSSQPFLQYIDSRTAGIGRSSDGSYECSNTIRGNFYFSQHFPFQIFACIHGLGIDHNPVTTYFSWAIAGSTSGTVPATVSTT